MEVLQNQPLFSHTTMKLGGPAKYLAYIKSEDDLLEGLEFAKKNKLELIVLGDGSNIIFSDRGFDGLVLINQITGFEIDQNTGKAWANSGENWDNFVANTIGHGLDGIESISFVPGTVGACPVNNIGAYGQEVSQSITKLRVYDTQNNVFTELTNSDCHFNYRNSVFKSEQYGRYIITRVYFKLNVTSDNYKTPKYASLLTALLKNGIHSPTPTSVRDTVIEIRSQKLPDPSVIANTGSFFKNPIITETQKNKLLKKCPDIVYFEFEGGYKLAAGWLIEQAGLKGYAKDGIKVFDKQALVLVNEGTRSYQSLENMKNYIQSKIYEDYGVMLEPEPEIIT